MLALFSHSDPAAHLQTFLLHHPSFLFSLYSQLLISPETEGAAKSCEQMLKNFLIESLNKGWAEEPGAALIQRSPVSLLIPNIAQRSLQGHCSECSHRCGFMVRNLFSTRDGTGLKNSDGSTVCKGPERMGRVWNCFKTNGRLLEVFVARVTCVKTSLLSNSIFQEDSDKTSLCLGGFGATGLMLFHAEFLVICAPICKYTLP